MKNFDFEKESMLREIYKKSENDECTDFKPDDLFKRRFSDFTENIVIYLLEREDAFFGQFMVNVKRSINMNIKVPVQTVPEKDEFNMYFNPVYFLRLEKKEMAAVFKHEIYHIINQHYKRERSLKEKYSKEIAGIALDISINQYIKDLPASYLKLDRIEREHNIVLEENKTPEEYADKIFKSLKKRAEKTGTSIKNIIENEFGVYVKEAHTQWDNIDVSFDRTEELTKKTAINAYRKNAPEMLVNIIKEYDEKAEIPWQSVLKRFLPSVKSGFRKTSVRLSRRQPERTDIRGRLPEYKNNIIIAIDISASIRDEEYKKLLLEVIEISRTSQGKITVIECDDEIRAVYDIKNQSDIRKRSASDGSTKFSPVFKYIKENNLKHSILIYFTDGAGEKELEVKPFCRKVLWVLDGDEDFSLKIPYGEVKRIKREKYEKAEGNEGLKMVNAVIHDWAR